MIKKSRQLICLLSVFIILSPSIIEADTITIAADHWYPYNGDPDSENCGYCIDIAKLVFSYAGHEIDYKLVPWTRALKDTKEGKYNAVVGALINEVPDFILPEEEIGLSEVAFFTRKDSSWTFHGYNSLISVITGAISRYSYGKEIDNFFKKNPSVVQYVHGEDPLRNNIKKLLAGRIDVIVADPNVFMYKSGEMNCSDQLRYAGSLKNKEKVYIAFSPAIDKSKEYARIFSEGLRRIKKDGSMEVILKKYNLKYWK